MTEMVKSSGVGSGVGVGVGSGVVTTGTSGAETTGTEIPVPAASEELPEFSAAAGLSAAGLMHRKKMKGYKNE